MPGVTRRIEPVALTADAWAPFGWLPVPDTDPADGAQRLAFEWGDPHVNLIGHARSEVRVEGDALVCDVLFRHRTHTQVLMALDHRCVLAVAAAEDDFEGGADGAAGVSAFVLEPLQAIVLHRGTWHWGPFPVSAEGVRLFNVQGLRYREDNDSIDLAARGLALGVAVAVG